MKYERLKLNENRLFKVAVVATMSSGKSTLINALAGQELLPSINQACTARTLALLDNDRRQAPLAHILYEDGTYERVENCTIDTIRNFNSRVGKPISDVVVECNIAGIHNAKTALMLVDTPGVNNHLDQSHGETTMNFLQDMTKGLVLYVLNATQLFVSDDDAFLRKVKGHLDRCPDLRVLFVINKMDSLDPEKEDLIETIGEAADYFKAHGIKAPVIIPVSAEAALLFKKALSGRAMSETEGDALGYFYKRYSKGLERSRDCRALVWQEEIQSAPPVFIDGESYSPAALAAALEQTGLPTLERAIESVMLQSVGVSAPVVQKIKTESED